VGLWFGWMCRHFPGPPPEVLLQLRELETPAVQGSTPSSTQPVGQR
jgi:hypothetical protein